ncbi:hypothetical protein CDAR_128611 [Caerostris darwini]|uniref:Uncharacterized protein n=1 Tax=Caerostris darwini TaxID=1538125 RepID=A0AAV4NFM6_9ARAC|nr:hypothetical protein CDAR_128611 [Caerostris darwini]
MLYLISEQDYHCMVFIVADVLLIGNYQRERANVFFRVFKRVTVHDSDFNWLAFKNSNHSNFPPHYENTSNCHKISFCIAHADHRFHGQAAPLQGSTRKMSCL